MLPTKFHFIWPSSFIGKDVFRNRPIRNKNCLWWPCLLLDGDEMSNLYREPSIDASYQVLVHFGQTASEEKIFRNRPIKNKNYLFVIRSKRNLQSLWRTFHRFFLPSFGSFDKAISEEKLFYKSTNQKQKVSVADMFVHSSGRKELS